MEKETCEGSKQGATARDAADNILCLQPKMFGSWDSVSTPTSTTIAASHGFTGPTAQLAA